MPVNTGQYSKNHNAQGKLTTYVEHTELKPLGLEQAAVRPMHVHEADASTLAAKRKTPKRAISKRAIICGFGKFEMSDRDKNCCALNDTKLNYF